MCLIDVRQRCVSRRVRQSGRDWTFPLHARNSLDQVIGTRQHADVALLVNDAAISSVEEIAFASEAIKVGPARASEQIYSR